MDPLVVLRNKIASIIIKNGEMHIIKFIVQLTKGEITSVTDDKLSSILNMFNNIIEIKIHNESSWSYKSSISNKFLKCLPKYLEFGIPVTHLKDKLQLYSMLIFVLTHIELLKRFKTDPEPLFNIITIDHMEAQKEAFSKSINELNVYKKSLTDKLTEIGKSDLIHKVCDTPEPGSFVSMIKHMFISKVVTETLNGVAYWEYINPTANSQTKIALKALKLYIKNGYKLPTEIDADSLYYILMPVTFHLGQCNKNNNTCYLHNV